MSDHLLSPIITAHCFWSPRCKHTVSDRPESAHAAMEAHYAAAHGRDMDRILGATQERLRRRRAAAKEVMPNG